MQAHGALSYSQAKSDSSRFTISRVIYSVKRTKDFAESIFGHAWSVIANRDNSTTPYSLFC